jgi:hypothetical protein
LGRGGRFAEERLCRAGIRRPTQARTQNQGEQYCLQGSHNIDARSSHLPLQFVRVENSVEIKNIRLICMAATAAMLSAKGRFRSRLTAKLSNRFSC